MIRVSGRVSGKVHGGHGEGARVGHGGPGGHGTTKKFEHTSLNLLRTIENSKAKKLCVGLANGLTIGLDG